MNMEFEQLLEFKQCRALCLIGIQRCKNTNENIQSLKKNNEKSGSKSRNKTVERRIVDF